MRGFGGTWERLGVNQGARKSAAGPRLGVRIPAAKKTSAVIYPSQRIRPMIADEIASIKLAPSSATFVGVTS